MLSKKSFKIILFFFLILTTFFTRFIKLDWGNGFFFHPDENNMVNSILTMEKNNLNPNFFAYGQFPLYLTYFTTPIHNFSTIALTLRFWSALFSSLSVLFFYLIANKIFKSFKLSFIFSLFIIFTPGLIQLSHFGTTESILIFIFALNIYFSFLFYERPSNLSFLFFSGLFSGIGIATKISAVIFLVPICFSFLFLFIQFITNKSFKNNFYLIFKFLLFIFLVCLFSVLFSPYNFINYSEFISSMKYETGVAIGSTSVFYTRQFIGSLPYLFQFQKIFPYTNGVFIFIFSFVGFYFILKSWIINHKSNVYLLITLFSCLIYFIYQGQLFTKWTRFMSPIFFVFPLFSIFFLQKIKSKFLFNFLIILCIIPGIYFLKTYFFSDIRIQATEWINQNIPHDSSVLSESGNVINIPVYSSQIKINNFNFYHLDDDLSYQQNLNQQIETSNYIFIPSRRVFKNQNNSNFPFSQNYYQNLFSGNLNFNQIKIFSNSNSLFLNPENAEETWSVFDNPTIRIFKKNNL